MSGRYRPVLDSEGEPITRDITFSSSDLSTLDFIQRQVDKEKARLDREKSGGGRASSGSPPRTSGVMGSSIQEFKALRNKRLFEYNTNIVTAYHQTDEAGYQGISTTGWRLGKPECIAGSAIYFAIYGDATDIKAHNHGVLLECQVVLGNMKVVPRIPKGDDSHMTFEMLQNQGFDSMKIKRDPNDDLKDEYVVYK